MEQQELRTLKILEALEQEESPSQRELARRLNVSLGLVNSFIKRLVNKGYFKVTTIPANRVKYMLTPKGVAEKTRLTYEYIQYSLNFYRRSRQKIRQILQTLESSGIHKVAMVGVSDLAEIAYLSLQETSLLFSGIIDDSNAGKIFFGTTVLGSSALHQIDFDKLLITAIEVNREKKRYLHEMGVPSGKIEIVESS